MIKKSTYRVLIIWGILILLCLLVSDTTVASDNGQATADFLNIGVDARSAAMGGAYTSVVDNVGASYWNPSGLASIRSLQLIFSHFSWYQDISFEYLAVAYPIGNRLTISASSSYLNYGSIEGYDIFNNPTGELESTYDFAASLSLGYAVTENLSAGVTGKFVTLSLDGHTASALAADLGAQYRLDRISFGAAVSNLGQKVRFNQTRENLPASLRVGLSFMPFGSSVMTTIEVEHQFFGCLAIKNGVEFSFHQQYFLRAGYGYHPGEKEHRFGHTLSFGAGAVLGSNQFDYAFSPKEKFCSENLHRFSVLLTF